MQDNTHNTLLDNTGAVTTTRSPTSVTEPIHSLMAKATNSEEKTVDKDTAIVAADHAFHLLDTDFTFTTQHDDSAFRIDTAAILAAILTIKPDTLKAFICLHHANPICDVTYERSELCVSVFFETDVEESEQNIYLETFYNLVNEFMHQHHLILERMPLCAIEFNPNYGGDNIIWITYLHDANGKIHQLIEKLEMVIDTIAQRSADILNHVEICALDHCTPHSKRSHVVSCFFREAQRELGKAIPQVIEDTIQAFHFNCPF